MFFLTNPVCFLDEVIGRIDGGDREFRYLNFRKAFDSANHRILDQKPEAFGVDARLNTWTAQTAGYSLQGECRGSSIGQKVATQDVASEVYLRAPLFLMYVERIACRFENPCVMFADGTKRSWMANSEAIQRDPHKVNQWSWAGI